MSFNTLHTITLHAIKVSLEWCAISELGLKVSELFDVIIIKSASHHRAPSIYLHAVNVIIIGSSIIFKHGGYQQCRITVVSPCAGYPYHFAKAYLDRSILHGLYSKFTSSLPNTYKRWQRTFSSKIWVWNWWLLKQVVSWGCKCIRRNWITWGPKTLQRVPGINSSPHSVSGKDIKRLAVFRPSKPAFPEVGSAHVFFFTEDGSSKDRSWALWMWVKHCETGYIDTW